MSGEDKFTIWTEKYRPSSFEEVVGQNEIVRRVQSLTEKENLPHLLFAGPPGVGKCLTGETPILCGDGTIKNIEDAYEEDVSTVLSLDENGRVTEQDVAYVYKEEADQTVDIETANGASFTVTPEHPFLVLRDGVPTWKEAQHIVPGDQVAAPSSYDVDGTATYTEKEAKLLGYIAGSNGEIQTSRVDEVRQLCLRVSGRRTTVEDNTVTIEGYDELVEHYGVIDTVSEAVTAMLTEPDRVVRGFLTSFLQRHLIVQEDTYHLPVQEGTTELAYLLRRHGVRGVVDRDGITLKGRNAAFIQTVFDLDIPSVETEGEPEIALAHRHIDRVMNALGIQRYEFSNDISTALRHRKELPESKATYIYQQLYEKAKSKIQFAITYLERGERLLEDEDAFVDAENDPRDEAFREELHAKTERSRMQGFKRHRVGDSLPDPHSSLNKLMKSHLHNEERYTASLRENALSYLVSSAIDEFNIQSGEVKRHGEEVPVNVVYDFSDDSVTVQTMSQLHGLATAVKSVVEQRIYQEDLLRSLELLHYLSTAQLTWEAVTDVSDGGEATVYDLNVEKTHSFIAGQTPIVNHNTTLSLVIAKELYGDTWRQNFLELNASDERGIDIVREKVKNFARTQSLGDVPFKIIYLDESDALTNDAQQALRRTMENYTKSCRFILSCNYSSKIIDPIQSRCTVFRFRGLAEDELGKIIDRISEDEGFEVTSGGREALIYASDGDVRRLQNILQTTSSITDEIDEETVYSIASYADPENIKEVLRGAISEDFGDAKEKLLKTMLKQGLSGVDVIKQFQKELWSLDVEEEKKLRMVKACGEAEFRLIEGADEHIQLDALLAAFRLD
jgi:replication factor C small subunit